MIDEYLQQLQNPDDEVRRSAIVALAKAKDAAALSALGRVYKEDPNPELRELALKAGRYIKQAQEQAATDAPPPPPPAQSSGYPAAGGIPGRQLTPLPPRMPSSPAGGMPPRAVSKADETRARGYLDAALNYYSSGDRARAVESLGRALEINPAMQKENVASNLAQTLSGLGHADAIELLADPYRRKALAASIPSEMIYTSSKSKRGVTNKPEKMVTWVDILLDMALFWLVVSIVLTAAFALGIKTLVDEYGDQMIEASARNPNPLTQHELDQLKDLSVVGMLFVSMFIAVSYSFSLIINGFAIHIAATMMLSGKNGFLDFMHRYIPFMTILALIMGIVGVIAILLISPAPGIASLLWTLMGIGGLASILVLAWLIGSVYDFGMPYGCATMILSVIVSCVMGCLMNFVFSALLGGGSSSIIIPLLTH